MSRARFTGHTYITRNGVRYADNRRWWVSVDWSGWWEILPPTIHPDWRKRIKRFPPGTYWTHVIPYLNSKGTSDVRTGS